LARGSDAIYRWLRDGHPLYWDAPNEMYIVSRYFDVDAVLKDSRAFSSTPLYLVDHDRVSPLREEDPPRHRLHADRALQAEVRGGPALRYERRLVGTDRESVAPHYALRRRGANRAGR
jgi:hypothetical protein